MKKGRLGSGLKGVGALLVLPLLILLLSGMHVLATDAGGGADTGQTPAIIAFAPLAPEVAQQSATAQTPPEELPLPPTLGAQLAGQEDFTQIAVESWQSAPAYTGEIGAYVFTPVVGYTLAENVALPTIQMEITAAQVGISGFAPTNMNFNSTNISRIDADITLDTTLDSDVDADALMIEIDAALAYAQQNPGTAVTITLLADANLVQQDAGVLLLKPGSGQADIDMVITSQGGQFTLKTNTAMFGVGMGVDLTLENIILDGTDSSGNTRFGALFNVFDGSSLTMEADSQIINARNDVTVGGAIYCGIGATANLKGAISDSQAPKGGAVYNLGEVNIDSTAGFTDNSATQDGGAIYNAVLAQGQNQPVDQLFTYHFGLGAAAADVTGNLQTVSTAAGASFSSNSAANGGAIYNAATADLKFLSFSGDSATKGGAIYNAQDATMTLGVQTDSSANVDFSSCTADYGGAVYNSYGRLSMYYGGIDQCTAAVDGGGIYYENTASDYQGTLSISGFLVQLYRTEITDCTAVRNGGGLYLGAVAQLQSYTAVTSCQAGGKGQGVYCEQRIYLGSGAVEIDGLYMAGETNEGKLAQQAMILVDKLFNDNEQSAITLEGAAILEKKLAGASQAPIPLILIDFARDSSGNFTFTDTGQELRRLCLAFGQTEGLVATNAEQRTRIAIPSLAGFSQTLDGLSDNPGGARADYPYVLLTPRQYGISYAEVDGVDMSSYPTSYYYHSGTEVKDAPEELSNKRGYIPHGWKIDGTTTTFTGAVPLEQTGDITLIPDIRIATYTIDFVDVTPDEKAALPTTYTVETAVTVPALADRPGQTFLGWSAGSDDTPSGTYSIALGSIGNLQLKANWGNKFFNISYIGLAPEEAARNINPSTYEYSVGVPVLQQLPQVEGARLFTGWFTQAEGGQAVTFIDDAQVGDVQVYAQFLDESIEAYPIFWDNAFWDDAEYPDYKRPANLQTYYIKGEAGQITLPILPRPSEVYESGYWLVDGAGQKGLWYSEFQDFAAANEVTGTLRFTAKYKDFIPLTVIIKDGAPKVEDTWTDHPGIGNENKTRDEDRDIEVPEEQIRVVRLDWTAQEVKDFDALNAFYMNKYVPKSFDVRKYWFSTGMQESINIQSIKLEHLDDQLLDYYAPIYQFDPIHDAYYDGMVTRFMHPTGMPDQIQREVMYYRYKHLYEENTWNFPGSPTYRPRDKDTMNDWYYYAYLRNGSAYVTPRIGDYTPEIPESYALRRYDYYLYTSSTYPVTAAMQDRARGMGNYWSGANQSFIPSNTTGYAGVFGMAGVAPTGATGAAMPTGVAGQSSADIPALNAQLEAALDAIAFENAIADVEKFQLPPDDSAYNEMTGKQYLVFDESILSQLKPGENTLVFTHGGKKRYVTFEYEEALARGNDPLYGEVSDVLDRFSMDQVEFEIELEEYFRAYENTPAYQAGLQQVEKLEAAIAIAKGGAGQNNSSPQTGDVAQQPMWFTLCAAAFAGMGIATVMHRHASAGKRGRRNKRN